MAIQLQSPAFADGEAIPLKYTGDGRDVSPPLSWSGIPEAARELVLIVDDPDAPGRQPWVHWLAYKISPEAEGLPEGLPAGAILTEPVGLFQGRNSWGRLSYGGPAPPGGHGVHHYRFTLYALAKPLDALHSLPRDLLEQAMLGLVIEEGRLVGTYQRT